MSRPARPRTFSCFTITFDHLTLLDPRPGQRELRNAPVRRPVVSRGPCGRSSGTEPPHRIFRVVDVRPSKITGCHQGFISRNRLANSNHPWIPGIRPLQRRYDDRRTRSGPVPRPPPPIASGSKTTTDALPQHFLRSGGRPAPRAVRVRLKRDPPDANFSPRACRRSAAPFSGRAFAAPG